LNATWISKMIHDNQNCPTVHTKRHGIYLLGPYFRATQRLQWAKFFLLCPRLWSRFGFRSNLISCQTMSHVPTNRMDHFVILHPPSLQRSFEPFVARQRLMYNFLAASRKTPRNDESEGMVNSWLRPIGSAEFLPKAPTLVPCNGYARPV